MKVTSLIGTSLTSSDLCKFMAEADKVSTQTILLISSIVNQLTKFQDGNGKIDYEEFVAMMKQY